MYIQDTAFVSSFLHLFPPLPLSLPLSTLSPSNIFFPEQLNPSHHLHRIRNPRTRRIRKLISRSNRHIGIINFRRRRRNRSRQRKVRSLQYRGTDGESCWNVNNVCDVAIDVGEVYTRGGNNKNQRTLVTNTSLKKKEGRGEEIFLPGPNALVLTNVPKLPMNNDSRGVRPNEMATSLMVCG